MTFGLIPGPVRFLLAAAIFLYLVWWTVRRLRGNRADPNVSVAAESETGSVSFLASGTALMLIGVLLIAGFLWPAPVQFPVVGLVLVGLIVAHWMIERGEG